MRHLIKPITADGMPCYDLNCCALHHQGLVHQGVTLLYSADHTSKHFPFHTKTRQSSPLNPEGHAFAVCMATHPAHVDTSVWLLRPEMCTYYNLVCYSRHSGIHRMLSYASQHTAQAWNGTKPLCYLATNPNLERSPHNF